MPFLSRSQLASPSAWEQFRKHADYSPDTFGPGRRLFLDEIGGMSPQLQGELLAVMDAGELGVRLIAGTSHSLLAQIAADIFSEALFYRLNVIHLRCPSQYPDEGAPVTVRDVMSAPAETCRANANLSAVAKLMWDHDCGFVPIAEMSAHRIPARRHLGVTEGVALARRQSMPSETRNALGWNTWFLVLLLIVVILFAWGFYLAG